MFFPSRQMHSSRTFLVKAYRNQNIRTYQSISEPYIVMTCHDQELDFATGTLTFLVAMGRAKRHGGEDADPPPGPPGPPPAPPVDPILAGIFANNPLGNQCPGEENYRKLLVL